MMVVSMTSCLFPRRLEVLALPARGGQNPNLGEILRVFGVPYTMLAKKVVHQPACNIIFLITLSSGLLSRSPHNMEMKTLTKTWFSQKVVWTRSSRRPEVLALPARGVATTAMKWLSAHA